VKIVTATRGLFQDTLLCRSLTCTPGDTGTCIVVEHNTVGLSKLYNQHMAPEAMVFMHDDIVVTNFWWREVIEEGLKHFDIVGVVGNKRSFPGQRSWYLSEDGGYGPDLHTGFSGAIGNGTDWCSCTKQYFGPCGEVKTLDGVFIAANGKTLIEKGVLFDEDFDFHFYDMAFCARARAAGLTMGTIPLSLIHNSKGLFTPAWQKALELYRSKYD